jgi:hypothetical protein
LYQAGFGGVEGVPPDRALGLAQFCHASCVSAVQHLAFGAGGKEVSMKTLGLAAALLSAIAFAPFARAQEVGIDPTSATPAVQLESAARLWAQFVALEGAWDPALGALYMDGSSIDRTTLTASGPELKRFTAEAYRAALPAIFAEAMRAGATEAWTNVQILYDGPARTVVTADLTITANGIASPTAKAQFILFDVHDGPIQVTRDSRSVAASGYTVPADEGAPLIAALDAALGTLDSSAIGALFVPDGKVVQIERSIEGDELGRYTPDLADFPTILEEEFGPLRKANGRAHFIVQESRGNDDGTWLVRGASVSSAPDSHDWYNAWDDTLTLVQQDGAWKIGTWERSFRQSVH